MTTPNPAVLTYRTLERFARAQGLEPGDAHAIAARFARGPATPAEGRRLLRAAVRRMAIVAADAIVDEVRRADDADDGRHD